MPDTRAVICLRELITVSQTTKTRKTICLNRKVSEGTQRSQYENRAHMWMDWVSYKWSSVLLFLDASDPQKLQEIPTGPSVLRPRPTPALSQQFCGVWNGSSSHIFSLQTLSSTPRVPVETQVHTHLCSSLFMGLSCSWLGHWVIILHLPRIQQGINNTRVTCPTGTQSWAR